MSVKKGANCQRCTTTFHIFTRGIYPPKKGFGPPNQCDRNRLFTEPFSPSQHVVVTLWSYMCAPFLQMQWDILSTLKYFFSHISAQWFYWILLMSLLSVLAKTWTLAQCSSCSQQLRYAHYLVYLCAWLTEQCYSVLQCQSIRKLK